MPLFKYKATTPEGEVREGSLEAVNQEVAVNALQKRNLILISIKSVEEKVSFFEKDILSLSRIKKRDIVIFSRQLSTLFEAKVPVLSSLKLLASETENVLLKRVLASITEDIEGGAKIHQALARHPKIFSKFYVNMVRSGEESGKLEEIFIYLAEHLERSYELGAKAIRALIYPAFVVAVFIGVMVVMLISVIPKLGDIIEQSGQEAPVYTRVVMAMSQFMRSYGLFLLLFLAIGAFFFWRYTRTKKGSEMLGRLQLSTPFVGVLYRKMYLARIADNLKTLISGGVTIVESLEITADTVDNYIYKALLQDTTEAVKSGSNISESLARYEEISPLTTQMIKIGEETGKLSFILGTLAKFYEREVNDSLETLISLIEPLMIIFLGLAVGILLASVLIPIYNIALSI